MTTSVEQFRTEFTDMILDFLWRQWCQLGIAGSVKAADTWIIDPEPLLALTTEIGRHDARMFDEVMEWLAVNGQWINTQRLSTIIESDDVGDKAVVGALASWLSANDKSMKWRGLAARMKSHARQPEEPLFHVQAARTGMRPGQIDDIFRGYGLIRPPVKLRGMAQAVNMKVPATLIFKSRAVFGLGIRADVFSLLMTCDGSHARRAAAILGYNHMRVQDVLAALAEAGVVSVHPDGRTKQYRLDSARWHTALTGRRGPIPRWVNWRSLVRGLTRIWRATRALDAARADEYIFSSEMRIAMRSARNDLLASGLGFEIEADEGFVAETYLPVFMRDMRKLLANLTTTPANVSGMQT